MTPSSNEDTHTLLCLILLNFHRTKVTWLLLTLGFNQYQSCTLCVAKLNEAKKKAFSKKHIHNHDGLRFKIQALYQLKKISASTDLFLCSGSGYYYLVQL